MLQPVSIRASSRGENSLRGSATASAATQPSGGRPFAGGRPLETPFGTVFATNITPDRETGIGPGRAKPSRARCATASREAATFSIPPSPTIISPTPAIAEHRRAVCLPHDAAGRAGAGAGQSAERAFRFPAPAGRLEPALPSTKVPSPTIRRQSADWNRGRALAEGLAHCGGCHTPRNEPRRRDRATAPTTAAGRRAGTRRRSMPSSPAVRPWTADALFAYLRTGLSATHAAAAGPMGERHARACAGVGRRCPRDRRLFRFADGKRAGRARRDRRQQRATSRTPAHPEAAALCSPAPAPSATRRARR